MVFFFFVIIVPEFGNQVRAEVSCLSVLGMKSPLNDSAAFWVPVGLGITDLIESFI